MERISKKFSYRRGMARRAVSVETLRNVAQMFVELLLISFAIGEWPSRSSKVIGNGTNPQAIWFFLLVVRSNNVSILHHFFDTTTFTLYVTRWLPVRGPNLKKSFIFGKQRRLKTADTFSFMYTHKVVNMCHIHWRIGFRKERFQTAKVTFKVTQGH